jgi:cytochrome c peroxidase
LSIKHILITSCAVTLLSGCLDSNNDKEVTIDEELRTIISEQNISAKPEGDTIHPSIDEPISQLGMKLFFSKGLGGEQDSACVTCHHPKLGGGDRLALPIGVHAVESDLLGPGRLHSESGFGFDGGPTVPRNAPSTFNIGLYKKSIFHDGRIETLSDNTIRTPDSDFGITDANALNLVQAQAMFPVTSPEEMRGEFVEGESNDTLRESLMARFTNQEIGNSWYEEFASAFNSTASAEELLTIANVSLAIGEYERSQVFVENDWRKYVDGDDSAINESAKRGAKLFYQSVEQGGSACVSCHSGDFFTDEQHHVVAFPQIGRGKGDGSTGDDDFGRYRETQVDADKYAFRTPTLLNVLATFPYGHAGSYSSLTDVVKHHINASNAIDEFYNNSAEIQPGMQVDNVITNTDAALAQLTSLQQSGESLLPNVDLSDEDVADLVSFLTALTDPCVLDDSCLADWIPDDEDTNPDGLRLVPSVSFSADISQ